MLFDRAYNYGIERTRLFDEFKAKGPSGAPLEEYRQRLTSIDYIARSLSGFNGGTSERIMDNSKIFLSSTIFGALIGGFNYNRPILGALTGAIVSTLGLVGRSSLESLAIQKGERYISRKK